MSDIKKQPIQSCRCTNCGAPLEIMPGAEYVACAYCDTVFRVEKASNKEVVINNVQNIHVEKKGFAQAAFEYLDNRAKAADAERERIRAIEEAKAARKRKMWVTIGQMFLWIYFFPIMLAVALKRQSDTKKENERLIDKGLQPKSTDPFPVALALIGGAFWAIVIAALVGSGRTPESYTLDTESNPYTSSVSNDATGGKWYDRSPSTIKRTSFSGDTITVTNGSVQYEVPAVWCKRESDRFTYYYPTEEINKTFLMVSITDVTSSDDGNFDLYSQGQLNDFLDTYYTEMIKSEQMSDSSAIPCVVNNFKGMIVYSKFGYDDYDAHGEVISTVLPTNHYLLLFSALMANGDDNISVDDFCAVLNSIRIID